MDEVSRAAKVCGYSPTTFPPTPSDAEVQELRVWLSGSGGLLVTSNMQYSGMEAPTCLLITNSLPEETGARSGLLRATARLGVVSYDKQARMEVERGFTIVNRGEMYRNIQNKPDQQILQLTCAIPHKTAQPMIVCIYDKVSAIEHSSVR